MSRSPGCRDRRIQPQLGQFGSPLPIPPVPVDLEGFGEAETIGLRQRNLGVPRTGGQGLVSQPASLCSHVVQAVSVSATGRRGLPGGPAGADTSNHVQFIRDHVSSRFPDDPVTAELMSLPIRPLSANKY